MGCDDGYCVEDWKREGLDLSSPSIDDMSVPEWLWFPSSIFPGWDGRSMFDLRDDPAVNKCYKVRDDNKCGEIPLDKKEIAAGIDPSVVVWSCSNGNNVNSKCDKSCAEGYIRSGREKTKSCDCANKCIWKGFTGSCKPALCQLTDDLVWPEKDRRGEMGCFDKDGNPLDWDAHSEAGFPLGTYCEHVCTEGFQVVYQIEYFNYDPKSTCICEEDTGRCYFKERKLRWCDKPNGV